ncbi:hypothetical protein M0R45_005982 [Rubus argutus]|uniref:RNase H type-1 domain-containing protein n=1 Tax=Rubus argutus TaxID=59490 RepID=A0AAW1YP90_RUBAR
MLNFLGWVGVVIQNHNAKVVGGMCLIITNVHSPEMVEASADCAACELAIMFALAAISFEVDSLLAVQASKGTDLNTFILGHIYDDISASLIDLQGASFFHVYRASSVLAHKLGKLALRINLNVT